MTHPRILSDNCRTRIALLPGSRRWRAARGPARPWTGSRRRGWNRCWSGCRRSCWSWGWRWSRRSAGEGVSTRDVLWRANVAEILCKESGKALYAGSIQAGDPSACAIDHVKALVQRRVLIQAHLKIRRVRVVGKTYNVPLDVKNTVGRAARHRGEDPATICPTRAAA